MIALAELVDPEAQALRKRMETEVEEPKRSAYADLANAKFAIEGTNTYPDATFTLRLAFGTVKGYEENGKHVPFETTFAGLYERSKENNDKPPFDLPPRWVEKKDKLDLKTPLNFVCTADIIGGNSGSPVINRDAELVGIIFDGNIQSLVLDFVYSDEAGAGGLRPLGRHHRSAAQGVRRRRAGGRVDRPQAVKTNHRGTENTGEYNTEKTKGIVLNGHGFEEGFCFLCVVFLCDLCASVVRSFFAEARNVQVERGGRQRPHQAEHQIHRPAGTDVQPPALRSAERRKRRRDRFRRQFSFRLCQRGRNNRLDFVEPSCAAGRAVRSKSQYSSITYRVGSNPPVRFCADEPESAKSPGRPLGARRIANQHVGGAGEHQNAGDDAEHLLTRLGMKKTAGDAELKELSEQLPVATLAEEVGKARQTDEVGRRR